MAAKKKSASKSASKTASKKKAAAATATTSGDDSAGSAGAIDVLIARIGTGKKAWEARIQLKELDAKDVVPRLLIAFGDPRPKVRGAAYEMSTAFPDRRALTPLARVVDGLSDPEPGVRLSVLGALNHGGGPKNDPVYFPQRDVIRPGLERLLEDPDPRVKKQATVLWTQRYKFAD